MPVRLIAGIVNGAAVAGGDGADEEPVRLIAGIVNATAFVEVDPEVPVRLIAGIVNAALAAVDVPVTGADFPASAAKLNVMLPL